MLVLRELAYGPRRFSELRADLPGISANVLTQRLAELEKRGTRRARRGCRRRRRSRSMKRRIGGCEAAPVIGALGRWAARSPLHDPTLPMSHVSVMMSLQTLLSPERAEGIDARIGFRFGDGELCRDSSTTAASTSTRMEPADCAVTFIGGPDEVAAVIHGGAPFDLIQVEGDLALARRFVTLFPLPRKGRRS